MRGVSLTAALGLCAWLWATTTSSVAINMYGVRGRKGRTIPNALKLHKIEHVSSHIVESEYGLEQIPKYTCN